MKKEKTVEELVKESLYGPPKNIILYDDKLNSVFDVMECLMTFCGHTLYQAEQCTMIAHYNGKIAIKQGFPDELEPIVKMLRDNKLKVEIQ